MPGTNHHVESGFIGELPLNLKPPAEDLLKYSTMKQLILMRQHGIDDFFQKTYPFINDTEWLDIIDKVLLTKVSYFELNDRFSAAQMNKLLEIARFALKLPNESAQSIYQITEHRYPVFAKVIKNLIFICQKKVKQHAA
ncbi:MAG: hypothetical protein IBX48_02350 [Thiomicrospira sp.]|uniref:hypothetical protein n=1 Tax=Thiomicrospira sp. TaxID=935 RepID=UPI0019F89C59|nr:hypothetical protein [Thiomicrospira sp.]MBE0493158.1 hypothetical protein [Thiomicrospira sp.]